MGSTFTHEVRRIAKTHLEKLLREYPSMVRLTTTGKAFDRWCDLCATRVNQLEVEGYVKSKAARDDFIEKAAEAFAGRTLQLAEKDFENKESKLKLPENNNA